MADTKYTLLGAASALTGSEILAVVQGGNSLQTTVGAFRTQAGSPAADFSPASYFWCKQQATNTLTSTTAAQKLFNTSTNGALTIPVGVYFFEAMLYLLTMSATSGNGAFSLAGTATLNSFLYQVVGIDSTTPLTGAAAQQLGAQANASAASMITATTGTGMLVSLRGTFDCTVTGTIIPSIALVTAAAAVVQAGSFFKCWRAATTSGNTTSGSWS